MSAERLRPEELDQHEGRRVTVHGSDYSYEGWIDAVFRKRSGEVRCVVEDINGRLFIHNAGNIEVPDDAG